VVERGRWEGAVGFAGEIDRCHLRGSENVYSWKILPRGER